MAARANGYTVRGWKAIADFIDVEATSTAKRYELRPDDANPLPVVRFGGGVRARPEDLAAWCEREAQRNTRD